MFKITLSSAALVAQQTSLPVHAAEPWREWPNRTVLAGCPLKRSSDITGMLYGEAALNPYVNGDTEFPYVDADGNFYVTFQDSTAKDSVTGHTTQMSGTDGETGNFIVTRENAGRATTLKWNEKELTD